MRYIALIFFLLSNSCFAQNISNLGFGKNKDKEWEQIQEEAKKAFLKIKEESNSDGEARKKIFEERIYLFDTLRYKLNIWINYYIDRNKNNQEHIFVRFTQATYLELSGYYPESLGIYKYVRDMCAERLEKKKSIPKYNGFSVYKLSLYRIDFLSENLKFVPTSSTTINVLQSTSFSDYKERSQNILKKQRSTEVFSASGINENSFYTETFQKAFIK